MPDTEHGLQRVIPDKGDSPHRRREKVIVIGTILLVVIGIMTIFRHGSNAAPSTGGTDPNSGGSDYTGGPDASGAGGGGTYGDQLAGEIGSIPEQTAGLLNTNLQNQLNNARKQLQNTRHRLTAAQRNRKRASQRANREHRAIVRQHQEIQKLQHHPAHAGKKNAQHHPDQFRKAPHQPPPHKKR